MPKKKFPAKLILLLAIIALNLPATLGFDASQYPYFKRINLPASIAESAIIRIDYQILNYMKPDGSDIRITENGIEIPVKIIIKNVEEVAHKGKIMGASSTRPDFRGVSFSMNNLLDGDYTNNDNAYFQVDSTKDPNYAWFIVELQDSILTDKAKIWSLNSDYTWTDIQIEGSNDNLNWKFVKSKTKYGISSERTVNYPPVEYKYLRFSFWHTQSLLINEIEIFGAYSGDAVFFAKSAGEYKVYYGNREQTPPNYDTSALFTKKTTPILSLSRQEYTANYQLDSDNDGSVADNCPSTLNPDQKDSDGDGIGNACDNCPNNANADQMDKDNDGIGDACDNCPYNINPDQYDDNFNTIGYVCDDNDNDGVLNSLDNCAQSYNPGQEDKDRNGIGDACEDIDADGIPFSKDNCLNKYNPDQLDTDKDRIGDVCDNCPHGYNPAQFDKNKNKVGDECEDDDSDKVPNFNDNCPIKPNPGQEDSDSDGIGDACDNCINIKNADQTDSDRNSIGDICDDSDGDGLINPRDNCPNIPNSNQQDQNNNGVGDACEDDDYDGVMNANDNCPYVSNPKSDMGNEYRQDDIDGDGIGDVCDPKDDRITENRGLIWIVLAATILIVGFLAWNLSRKPLRKI